ncbi:putative integral membrane protein [Desulfosporosinus acidiphilus SJ4]|uniref:Putative integral membrane protein n=1 Tax=Desulfosporosinus acidiphilus (strain DSM 22704 / JCM 16185 / SJ4) TaxID=646529 RepID=I4D3Y6_DESAJ|nr:DUF975 family protein [Desulfosporosinus acidiphilus]AFM40510.1 putative integral membrane protein [Desulfosporosinus acidiphilus SJ4]
MPQESKDLKCKAKEQLKGYWLQAIIVCFFTWLLTIAFRENGPVYAVRNIFLYGRALNVPPVNPFSSISSFIKYILIGEIGWGDLISFILMGPLTLGASGFFLKLIRNEDPGIKDLGDGFKSFLKSFILNLLITIFTTLWSLLLIIPGIIAGFRYSMAYYIMMDNPHLSALEALKQSKAMMVGYKFDLFILELSFLGWLLLVAVTFGLALLWVNPYYEAAKVNFYQELKANSTIV